jgi:hypothetical protein
MNDETPLSNGRLVFSTTYCRGCGEDRVNLVERIKGQIEWVPSIYYSPSLPTIYIFTKSVYSFPPLQPTIYPTGSRHNLLKTSHLLIERLQPTFRLQSGP